MGFCGDWRVMNSLVVSKGAFVSLIPGIPLVYVFLESWSLGVLESWSLGVLGFFDSLIL